MGVVIAGIGLGTPLGPSREQAWQALLRGPVSHTPDQNPAATAEGSAVTQKPTDQACSGGLRIPEAWFPCAADELRLEALTRQLAAEAWADAGLQVSELREDPRCGLVIGTSKGPLEEYGRSGAAVESLFSRLWPSGPVSSLMRAWGGWRGPALCPVAACATGLMAVCRAAELIEQGDCDLALAGSVDASLNPYVLASYRRLGVLARNHRPLTAACQPFDRQRSGFVIGEGGALFVLAREGDPRIRPERIYARWRGGVQGADPAGLTQLDATGTRLSRLLGECLLQAGLRTADIGLLHLHGTGTRDNDLAEARAVAAVFGDPSQQPWSTASKGAHGHALGGAGSIELAWLLLSLRDGLIPSIWNLHDLDDNCPLRAVKDRPQIHSAQVGMKISLGFGGHQVVSAVERGTRPTVLYALS